MSSLTVGLGLALLASLALNGSFLAQHAGARDAPAVSPRHPLATLRGLLGSPIWIVGSALGLFGWMLHLGALANAPLSLVQPFAAGGLALAVPAAARFLGERLSRRERAAVAIMVLALVGLSVGATAGPAGASFGAPLMILYLMGAAALAALLAALPSGAHRPHALGAAAGVLYGAADTATKAVTATAHALSAVPANPWVLAVAVASVAAFFAFQRGLQIGQAIPVIALMTVTTNLVAIVGGLLVFGEPLGASRALAALHLAGFGLASLAAWLLAGAHARLAERGAARRAGDTHAPVGLRVPSAVEPGS
jgi:drug/metabolite transporter (DMT)-like permease